MQQREMTAADLVLAIAQTYSWGKSARLNAYETHIVDCRHTFNSEREQYTVAFTIPATINAVMDTQEALEQ